LEKARTKKGGYDKQLILHLSTFAETKIGETQICNTLLSAKADIHAVDRSGKMLGCMLSRAEAIRCLQSIWSRAGSTSTPRTLPANRFDESSPQETTPHDNRSDSEWCETEYSRQARQSSVNDRAAYGNGLIVDALQRAGADPSQANDKGQTAYASAREQHTAAVDYLKTPAQ
jgi:hypothetical protein